MIHYNHTIKIAKFCVIDKLIHGSHRAREGFKMLQEEGNDGYISARCLSKLFVIFSNRVGKGELHSNHHLDPAFAVSLLVRSVPGCEFFSEAIFGSSPSCTFADGAFFLLTFSNGFNNF